MKAKLASQSIIECVIDCGTHFSIAARAKDPGDVRITCPKKAVLSHDNPIDLAPAPDDRIVFMYAQDLVEKATEIVSLHAQIFRPDAQKPHISINLMMSRVTFPAAFKFPKEPDLITYNPPGF